MKFVIQKHHASHLHYDLRLELNGVLKSWAVPKGIPTKSSEKHLAIQVEDHPIAYASFEGVIPEGHYGAGKVEIWDEGTYTVPGVADQKEMEKEMEKGLKKGHINILFHGKKLKKTFALIKMSQKDQWLLLMKKERA